MPEISRFYGIVVTMYWDDHAPPHFHVRYGSHKAVIRITPVGLMRGDLPPRILGMVVEWAAMRRTELLANWELGQRLEPLQEIEGLA